MKKWLLNYNYDSVSFSFFRITIYSAFLYFYGHFNLSLFNSWEGIDPAFWQPISFFQLLPYSDWSCVNHSYLYPIFILTSVCCILGFQFRFFSLVTFSVFAFSAGFPCNFGKVHHSNHMPAVLLGLMCFVPAGYYSIDAYFKKEKKEASPEIWAWIFFTIMFYMCLVYFNAGVQKLRTGGLAWIENESLATIILTRPTVTPLGEWVAQSDWLPGLLAKLGLLIELCAPMALFLKNPLRFLYGLSLFMLHQGNYMLLGDHGAFFPYQICFLAWVPWKEVTQFLCSGNIFKKLVPWYRSSR